MRFDMRRPNTPFVYNQYSEVNFLPKTSDHGERVNIFLTELERLSHIYKLTSGANYIYFKYEQMRAILSNNQYIKYIDELIDKQIVKQIEIKNIFNYNLYAFKPIDFKPIKTGVKIRNLKVRNSVRNYLNINSLNIETNVKKWLTPGLINTEIEITKDQFLDNLSLKYKNYFEGKKNKYEKPLDFESYKLELINLYNSVKNYQITTPEKRIDFLTQDNFSGRIYNIATGAPKWLRSHYKINGKYCAEIDLKSAHAVLLWLIAPKTDLIKFLYNCYANKLDFYIEYGKRINIYNRKKVKIRFLRGLYGPKNSRFYKEIKNIFPGAGEILDRLKTDYLEANPSKLKGMHTNLAFLLLNLEVKIFKKVWAGLYAENITFLSIHDGILIAHDEKEKAEVIIKEIIRQFIPIAELEIIFY